MQFFAWFWILAMTAGLVLSAARLPRFMWRGLRWGMLCQVATVSMFVVHLGTIESQSIVMGTGMILGVPATFWFIRYYPRFVRRFKHQRLCADCAYPLPAENFEGLPCPECGSTCWLVVPEDQTELFKQSPGMPKYWIEKRLLVLVSLLCVAILGLGRELANGIGREIQHVWLASAVAIAVWMASAFAAIAVLIAVRDAADAKRIARDRSKAP